jgi:glycerophosphoryl diester phosphodiesterase
MKRSSIEPGFLALRDFRRTWPQLLLVTLATRLAVMVLLLPGLALLLRFFLSRQGRRALSDEEILFFFLSPVGLAALLVVGGMWIGVSLAEQAGLMTVGFGASENRRVTWYDALRYVLMEMPRILRLGVHLLVRALLLAVPILALVGAVYWLFLRHHDINYYLTNRPPEFLWAAGIAGALIAGLAVLLATRVISWLFALPAVLFENLRPLAAIRDSVADSAGHRWRLLWWAVAWLAAGYVASVLVTWIVGYAGRLVVPGASGSIALVAFAMGAIGLVSILANSVLSFLSAAFFAVLIVRLYRDCSGPGELSRDLAAAGSLGERPEVRIPRKSFLWGGAAVLAAVVAAAVIMVDSVRMEDDALIIAHRGASLHAPENTMAAFHRAIADGTDYIEIDVQETADGDVVVFHDSDFMKTAGNPLRIWDARGPDLERIDIGSWFDPSFESERVPTLEDVLLAARGEARVNIELKYYGLDQDLERRVVEIVERHDMSDQVVIMSLKYDKVQKVRSMRPEWTIGLLTTVNLGNPTAFEVDFLAVNAAAATRRFIHRAHRRGREVYVWTVNDPYAMSAMMSRGIDGIITDDPALARRVLEIRSSMDPVQRLLVGIGTEVGVFSMPEPEADEADA